jgi:lipid A 3-O-deacylase
MKNAAPLACRIAFLMLAAFAAGPVLAQDWMPHRAFIASAGAAEHGTYSLTLGVAWPWDWKRQWGSVQATAMTEAFISHWRADAIGGGQSSYTQIGLLPLLRLRFSEGRSPWFVEGGIGVTWMDKIYRIPERQFSTAGNFIDVLGVGRNFGEGGRHELTLRISHISNANIKKPNPGEDFLQLRYGLQF